MNGLLKKEAWIPFFLRCMVDCVIIMMRDAEVNILCIMLHVPPRYSTNAFLITPIAVRVNRHNENEK